MHKSAHKILGKLLAQARTTGRGEEVQVFETRVQREHPDLLPGPVVFAWPGRRARKDRLALPPDERVILEHAEAVAYSKLQRKWKERRPQNAN